MAVSYVTVYVEIGHMSAKLILRYTGHEGRNGKFVEVAFICLTFRVGIVESYQEV